jgi:hypothetical protein
VPIAPSTATGLLAIATKYERVSAIRDVTLKISGRRD